MLRHAEMPKGSRRVPTVYDGFILGLPHGVAGRLLHNLLASNSQPSAQPSAFTFPQSASAFDQLRNCSRQQIRACDVVPAKRDWLIH